MDIKYRNVKMGDGEINEYTNEMDSFKDDPNNHFSYTSPYSKKTIYCHLQKVSVSVETPVWVIRGCLVSEYIHPNNYDNHNPQYLYYYPEDDTIGIDVITEKPEFRTKADTVIASLWVINYLGINPIRSRFNEIFTTGFINAMFPTDITGIISDLRNIISALRAGSEGIVNKK